MNTAGRIILLLIAAAIGYIPAMAQAIYTDSALSILIPRIHFDQVYLDNHHIQQTLCYQATADTSADIYYSLFKFNSVTDSVLVVRNLTKKKTLKKGVSTVILDLSPKTKSDYLDQQFRHIVQQVESLPAGAYRSYVSLVTGGDTVTGRFVHTVDSTLPPYSLLRKIQKTLLPVTERKILGISLGQALPKGATGTIAQAVDRNYNRLARQLQSKGLTAYKTQKGQTIITTVYYQDWYIGKYEIDGSKSVKNYLQSAASGLTGNSPVAGFQNDLENYQSIFSQARTSNEQQPDDDEAVGTLILSSNLSSGREPNSEVDNNFQEVTGTINLPILGIPVGMEGFYTTQDRNRFAKASYFRIYYDVEKAKEELQELIGNYNTIYTQTVSKGQGINQMYQGYLAGLQNQKSGLLSQITSTYAVDGVNQLSTENIDQLQTTDTMQLIRDLVAKVDTSGKVSEKTQQLKAQYEKLQALEQKIQKYTALLDQYNNTAFFDSTLAYDKLKNLQQGDEATYKQLAKSASGLLPEGNAKKFISGITHFEAGMLENSISRYTLDGQRVKGFDLGYDLGFCRVGATAGKAEYISRDGNLEKYTSYSGRVLFEPAEKQKIGLIYYGQTPSRDMGSKNNFFSKADIAIPSFWSPTHIVSLRYDGGIGKHTQINGEIAGSYKKTGETGFNKAFSGDNLAYNIGVTSAIPKTTIDLNARYETAGKNFENNSLPILLSGTTRYTAGARGVFFKSFLTLSVECNYLQQQNFTYQGNNMKWGFEVRTKSKRYPSALLSYKPFTTFRTYTDDSITTVQQQPLIGSVWIGKLNYTVKKNGYSLRFQALYNRNNSIIDTIQYGGELEQFSCGYMTKKWMSILNLGRSKVHTNQELPSQGQGNVSYGSLMLNCLLSSRVSLGVSQELGYAVYGFSKYAATLTGMYRLKKTPISLRATARYNTYEAVENGGWKNIIGGNLDVAWNFKFKILDDE